MIFAQYYLDCLSQASYLIGDASTGVAAVVDPRRDVVEYLADAEAQGLEIRYVVETHFHADFLSGHLELAEATGATIIYGAAATPAFPVRHVEDGERITLGEVVLEFRATPGHTPESICVVVYEHASDAEPYGVLTGDTLFIGDVGRPDLLASTGVTADELARQLHGSLHDKLLTLPDATRVFPAHGAGSACGKNLSTETTSTIGEQRRTNYALQPLGIDAFVAAITEGQSTAPAYFAHDATLNKTAHRLLDTEAPVLLDLDHVIARQASGGAVIDTRDAISFAAGHLRGSINVGLDGRYAEYAGSVIEPEQDIVVLTDPGEEADAKTRLARIGFDRVIGAVAGGAIALAARPDLVERASRLSAIELRERLTDTDDLQLIDVRAPGEHHLGAIPGARSIPLPTLTRHLDDVDLTRPVVVYCAGGYRSSIAASTLRSRGAVDVSDLLGGYGAWTALTAPPNPRP